MVQFCCFVRLLRPSFRPVNNDPYECSGLVHRGWDPSTAPHRLSRCIQPAQTSPHHSDPCWWDRDNSSKKIRNSRSKKRQQFDEVRHDRAMWTQEFCVPANKQCLRRGVVERKTPAERILNMLKMLRLLLIWIHTARGCVALSYLGPQHSN